jgi:hypothetical protein
MLEGLAILAGTVFVLLEVAVARAVQTRLIEHRAATVRSAGRALFFARRLHAMACRWSASGSSVAGSMACRFALGPLLEARKGLARIGDGCLIVRIDQELGRNTDLACVCGRGLFRSKEVLILKETSLMRALQGAQIRLWIEEAEGLSTLAAAQFDDRRYRAARETYRSAKASLSTAFKAAKLFGRPELLPAIRRGMEACIKEIEACNAWIVENDVDSESPKRLYVKGRIDPYFRRDDGSARARPDRPGFWGASGHMLFP